MANLHDLKKLALNLPETAEGTHFHLPSASYFLKKGELEDTFKIAEILVNDDHDDP